jgi:hypothetical protein
MQSPKKVEPADAETPGLRSGCVPVASGSASVIPWVGRLICTRVRNPACPTESAAASGNVDFSRLVYGGVAVPQKLICPQDNFV